MKIGGNIDAVIEIHTMKQNEIGEDVKAWVPVLSFSGWLDLAGGDSKYMNFNTKIQESTHIFICDYFPLVYGNIGITPENSRMIVDNKLYEVNLYDNPLHMNEQLEIYLNYTGGQ